MTALGAARLATGAASLVILGVMVWIGETRITPVVPDGVLLQGQVLGYDTNQLAKFAIVIAGSEVADVYRATLTYLDTLFILAFSGFAIAMLWPWRAAAAGLALLYAGADIAENVLILDRIDQMAGIFVLYTSVTSEMSIAGKMTVLKFAAIGLIMIAIAARWFIQWSRRR